MRIFGTLFIMFFEMKNKITPFFLTLLFFFLFSCTSAKNLAIYQNKASPVSTGKYKHQKHSDKAKHLEQDLAALLGYQDKETALLAQAAVDGANSLTRKYRVKPPARFHNILVNLGIRDRGLCCHWTQDLLGILNELQLEKYRLFWAVANHGSLGEHNSVVVAATDQTFSSGIVLDAWRHAGELYWARVGSDKYEWYPHPGDDGTRIIVCRKNGKISPSAEDRN